MNICTMRHFDGIFQCIHVNVNGQTRMSSFGVPGACFPGPAASTLSALPEHLGSGGSTPIPRPRPGTQCRSRAPRGSRFRRKAGTTYLPLFEGSHQFPRLFQRPKAPSVPAPLSRYTQKTRVLRPPPSPPQSARGSASLRAERKERAPHLPAQGQVSGSAWSSPKGSQGLYTLGTLRMPSQHTRRTTEVIAGDLSYD